MTKMYEVVLTAVGEVRDIDGNLVSAEPIEAKFIMSADELATLTEGDI